MRTKTMLAALLCTARLVGEDVSADFSQPAALPLSKKFGLMNTGGLSPQSQYTRDLPTLAQLAAGSLRLDLSIGKQAEAPLWWDIVGGADPDHLTYDFANVDWLNGALASQNVQPYWDFVYIPVPFQLPAGSYPSDNGGTAGWQYCDPSLFNWGQWQVAAQNFSAHLAGSANKGYYEAMNEPDLLIADSTTDTGVGYFLRTPNNNADIEAVTFQMYETAAKGFKAGDANAVVGGPALSGFFMDPNGVNWTGPFLDAVAGTQSPIDFFSFHVISGADPFSAVIPRTQVVRNELSARPWTQCIEIHMNEYNAYGSPWAQDTDSSDLATMVIENISALLPQHDLTVVSWAQAMDNSPVQNGVVVGDQTAGLIAWDGTPRRAFTTMAMYDDIPLAACQSTNANAISTMAAADRVKAGIIVWNSDQNATTTVPVTASNIPFANAVFSVYQVDPSATGNPGGLNALYQATVAITGPQTYTLTLPPRSVAYLRWMNTAAPTLAPPAGTFVRVCHAYPNRSTSSYAEYDRRRWTACLGMATSNDQEIEAVTVQDLAAILHVDTRRSGAPSGGTLGLRIDYQTGAGYAKAVLFEDGENASFSIPWGNGRGFDQDVPLPSLAAADIRPGDYAPAGWNGQAIITFVLNATGNGSQVAFTLSAGTAAAGGGGGGGGTGGGSAGGSGTGNGLLGHYFPLPNFGGTAVERVDPLIDFDWSGVSPIAPLGTTGYSVRWTGTIQAQFSETYAFAVTSDDGARLWVDGTALVDDWNDQPATTSTGEIALTAGQSYPIILEYYQDQGLASVTLAWSSPSTPLADIPTTQLSAAELAGGSPPAGAASSGTPADGGSSGHRCGLGFALALLLLQALGLARVRAARRRYAPSAERRHAG
jgi:hypothetical protein